MEERDPEDTSTRMEIQMMPVFMICKSRLEFMNLFYLLKKFSSTNIEIMTKVIAKEREMPNGVFYIQSANSYIPYKHVNHPYISYCAHHMFPS